jgi:hypothetical protein
MLRFFKNPDYENESGRDSINKDVRDAINSLLERKLIIQLRINIDGELHFVYHLSPDGETHYNSLVTFGRILQYDLDVFDMSLRYIPDFGEIYLSRISEIYADRRFFRVEIIERILLESGFATKNYNGSDYSKYSLHLTEKGRDLKEQGSLSNYDNFKKMEEDRLRLQSQQNLYSFWFVVFAAIGTCVSAVFDSAQLFVLSDTYGFEYTYFLVFLFGVGITLLSQRILKIIKK